MTVITLWMVGMLAVIVVQLSMAIRRLNREVGSLKVNQSARARTVVMDAEKTEISTRKDVHVYPANESHLHNLVGRKCHCYPGVEIFSNGAALVAHNRILQ